MAFWMHCLHSRLGENVINSNLILLNTTIVFLLFAEETSAGGFSRQEKVNYWIVMLKLLIVEKLMGRHL